MGWYLGLGWLCVLNEITEKHLHSSWYTVGTQISLFCEIFVLEIKPAVLRKEWIGEAGKAF